MLLFQVNTAFATDAIVLKNGLQVYMKPTPQRSSTLDLRLILDFGASDEQPGERGWAHLLEHMAFNGTQKFDADRIKHVEKQMGARPGEGMNASTGQQHTVYQLTVPNYQKSYLENGLQLMVDWLSAMDFDPAALEKEKRVIAAETLERKDSLQANYQWQQKLLGTSDVSRSPLGIDADIKKATVDKLRQFWLKGYRTDRAKLMVIGDFNRTEVLELIRRSLGQISKPSSTIQELVKPKQVLKQPVNRVLSEPRGATRSRFALAKLAVGSKQIRRTTLMTLALQWQLHSVQQHTGCKPSRWRVDTLGPEQELHYLPVGVVGNNLFACLNELTRAALLLRDKEWSTDQQIQLMNYSRAVQQWLNQHQAAWDVHALADRLEERLIKNASMTTQAERLQSILHWIEGLDTRTLGEVLQQTLDPERLSLVLQPGVADTLPTSQQLDALWSIDHRLEFKARPIYRMAVAQERLPHKILHQDSHRLSLAYTNGATVHFLQTDNVSDHFDVLMVREGGLLSMPANLLDAATQLTSILPYSGMDSQSADAVQTAISNHKLGFEWFVDDHKQGIRASARGHGAKALFSLLHQSQLDLPFDFGETLQPFDRHNQQIRARAGQQQLKRLIWRSLYGISERSSAQVAAVGLEAQQLITAKKLLFSGASGLEIYVVGDFNFQELKKLTDLYVGSLPVSRNQLRRQGFYASTIRRRIVHKGNQIGRADLQFHYTQSRDNSLEKHNAELLLLRALVAQRLWESLREREGLVYHVDIQLQRRGFDQGGSSFKISLICDPAFIANIRNHVDRVLLSVLTGEIPDLELQLIQQQLAEDYRSVLKDNRSLIDEWDNQRRRGLKFEELRATLAKIETMPSDRLQNYARHFFRDTGFLEVNVVPAQGSVNAEKLATLY